MYIASSVESRGGSTTASTATAAPPLSSQKRKSSQAQAASPVGIADDIEEEYGDSDGYGGGGSKLLLAMTPRTQATPGASNRGRRSLTQRSVLEGAPVGGKFIVPVPDERENVPVQTAAKTGYQTQQQQQQQQKYLASSSSASKKRKGEEAAEEEEAPMSAKKTRSFGKEISASQLNRQAAAPGTYYKSTLHSYFVCII